MNHSLEGSRDQWPFLSQTLAVEHIKLYAPVFNRGNEIDTGSGTGADNNYWTRCTDPEGAAAQWSFPVLILDRARRLAVFDQRNGNAR